MNEVWAFIAGVSVGIIATIAAVGILAVAGVRYNNKRKGDQVL